MNINPHAKTILCYGDSNTHGTKPDRSGRYAVDERWPGVLQEKLGNDYYVIEEGLGGRTTNLEHPNPKKPSRNGLTYFKAAIDSHKPLDIVILMLGTNDFKTTYNRPVQETADIIKEYLEYIHSFSQENGYTLPKVILVSPPYMNSAAPKFVESMPTPGIYDETSVQKSHEIAEYLKRIADQTESLFLDSAPITQTGEDGCHLDIASHSTVASELYKLVI